MILALCLLGSFGTPKVDREILVCPVQDTLEKEVDRLVLELEDESIEVRDAAQEALVRLGRKVEPLLRARMEGAGQEVRARLKAVLNEIARRERIRDFYADPSPITLDLASAPLSRAVAEIGRQSRSKVEADPAAAEERVTARFSAIPFFRAVDELCRAHGGLRYGIECSGGRTVVTIRKGRYAAFPRVVEDRFTVWLDSVQFIRRSDLRGGGTSEGTLRFEAAWEDGNVPVRTRLRVTELVDEHGRSLLESVVAERDAGTASTRFPVRLNEAPKDDVTRFGLVRGVLEVTFPTDQQLLRFESPSGQIGKTVSSGGLEATLVNFTAADGNVVVSVRIRAGTGGARPAVRMRDKAGKELSLQRTSISRSGRDTLYNCTYTLPAGSEAGAVEVAALAGSLDRTVRFEFRDVPVRP
ncbi:MAG: hypothetical protein HYY17_13680 [Planctomycetes bacterium]|nr:hypothetical protein [Planctomycetota bacterium]